MGKACLKESCAFSPHCDSSYLHPCRTKGAARRDTKGTKSLFHTSTLPSLHSPRVYVLYSTHTLTHSFTHSHMHTLPGTRLLPSGQSVRLHHITSPLLPSPSAHHHIGSKIVAGYCPDAVIISLMLTQMSMGSSDKGFLIPHMNLAPKGREEAECVANTRELHEGAYITHNLSLALMEVFSEFS